MAGLKIWKIKPQMNKNTCHIRECHHLFSKNKAMSDKPKTPFKRVLINWSSASVSTSIKANVLAICWSGDLQVCVNLFFTVYGVNTMPKRKDISNDLREAIVAAINLGRVIQPFPNNLKSIIPKKPEHPPPPPKKAQRSLFALKRTWQDSLGVQSCIWKKHKTSRTTSLDRQDQSGGVWP